MPIDFTASDIKSYGVKISDKEKKLLTHGPKHKINDKLDKEKFELALEKAKN